MAQEKDNPQRRKGRKRRESKKKQKDGEKRMKRRIWTEGRIKRDIEDSRLNIIFIALLNFVN